MINKVSPETFSHLFLTTPAPTTFLYKTCAPELSQPCCHSLDFPRHLNDFLAVSGPKLDTELKVVEYHQSKCRDMIPFLVQLPCYFSYIFLMSNPNLPNSYLQLLPSITGLHVPCTHQEVTFCSLPSRSSWLLRDVSLSSCLSDWASPIPLGSHWSPRAIGSHHIPRSQHFSWASQPWLREITPPLNQPCPPRCLKFIQAAVEAHCAGFLSAALYVLGRTLLPQSSCSFHLQLK